MMPAKPIMPSEHPFVKAVAAALRQRCGVPARGPGARRVGIVVATSGGADSVALLRALAALADRRTWKLDLAVGHVQHHLRSEEHAEGDAAFVAALARALGLPFLRADLHKPAGVGNVEAWARTARYEALANMAAAHGAAFIATAHHADDQLETLLMRLLRGASVRGMRGIAWRRRITPHLTLIRPMLSVDRAAVRSFLKDIEQPWREDHTNADVTRLRARLRHEVVPALTAIQSDAPRRAVALADHLRHVGRMLDLAIAQAADRVLLKGQTLTLDRADARSLPPVVLTGLLRKLLGNAGVERDKLGTRALGSIMRAIRDTRGGRRVFHFGGGVEVVLTRDGIAVTRGNEQATIKSRR